MSCLTYCINHIKNSIPPQILNMVFTPKAGQRKDLRRDAFMPGNIDSQIIDKVIERIVRPDVDTNGVKEATICLAGIEPERIDNDKYLLHIPKKLTNGQEIISAIALIFYASRSAAYSPYQNNSTIGMPQSQFQNNAGALQLEMLAMGGFANPPIAPESTNLHVVEGNTVIVQDLLYPNPNSYMRVLLASDREFSTLQPTAWKAFAKLCELATKRYIYNFFTIEIDMAELVGGKELGKFKDIIDGYADAAEMYDDYFETKWRKIQFMADETRHTRYLKGLIGRFK